MDIIDKTLDLMTIILAIMLFFIMKANNNLIEFIAYILLIILLQIITIKYKI